MNAPLPFMFVQGLMPVMEVLYRERSTWMLLEEGGAYYLDVRCSLRDCSLCLLLKLNVEEIQNFFEGGRDYLDYLAARVRTFPQWYYSRNEPLAVQKRVVEAVSNLSRRTHKVSGNDQ